MTTTETFTREQNHSLIPATCCGRVECLGRTPEAVGNCSRATSIYTLGMWLDNVDRAEDRIPSARSPRVAANLAAYVADGRSRFDSDARHILTNLYPCADWGIPSFVRPGRRVSWDTWCGVATVTVTSLTEFRVFYTSDDGVSGMWEETCLNTLAHALRHLRPATAPALV